MTVAIKETNFKLPGQVGKPYHGKVGDVYTVQHTVGELMVVVRTDRISAFDVVLPEPIPTKGQVLNQMSAELLELTRSVAPNWLIESPDPNVTIGNKASPFKVEMIVRGFLLGSSWKAYKEKDIRDICGNKIPDGMKEFQSFDEVLLTPTTKADEGHDENITPEQIVSTGLTTDEEYAEMARLSLDLFAKGQVMAKERDLILADTKYEFGRLPNGQIVVIDEVHTPDSSRYFNRDQFNDYLEGRTEKRPEQLSKEFVREWLVAQGFTGDSYQEVPHLPEEFISEVARRYQELYVKMLGHSFDTPSEVNEEELLERIQKNIVSSLENISVA